MQKNISDYFQFMLTDRNKESSINHCKAIMPSFVLSISRKRRTMKKQYSALNVKFRFFNYQRIIGILLAVILFLSDANVLSVLGSEFMLEAETLASLDAESNDGVLADGNFPVIDDTNEDNNSIEEEIADTDALKDELAEEGLDEEVVEELIEDEELSDDSLPIRQPEAFHNAPAPV